MNAKSPDAFV